MSVLLGVVLLWASSIPAAANERLAVRVSWGHTGDTVAEHRVAISGSVGLQVRTIRPQSFEPGDRLQDDVAQTHAGKGDADALDLVLEYPPGAASTTQNVHVLWTDLIAASDADTARRLLRDPAFKSRGPALTIQLDAAGHSRFHGHRRSAAGRERLLDSLARRVRRRRRCAPVLRGARARPRAAQGPARPRSASRRARGHLRRVHGEVGGHGEPRLQQSPGARPRPHRRPDVGQRHPEVRHRPRCGRVAATKATPTRSGSGLRSASWARAWDARGRPSG